MYSLGIVMIVLASVLSGLTYIKLKDSRIKELNSVCLMLETMQRELEARLTPLPELFELIRDGDIGVASGFSETILKQMENLGQTDFRIIWNSCVEASFTKLNERELFELQRIGDVLGKYSVEKMNRTLSICHDYLKKALEADVGEYPQRRRLAIGLSVSAGAMLTIVLM